MPGLWRSLCSCSLWNLLGAPKVGQDSGWLFALLLAPFAVFVVLGFWRGLTLHPAIAPGNPASSSALSTAILVALWNYMGWDNASTVAQEVENPQRNYPRAMAGAIALTVVSYVLPLAAMALAGSAGKQLFDRRLGDCRARSGRSMLGGPSSRAAALPASACSTRW